MSKYVFKTTRNGEIIPALVLPDGNIQPLHSMVDPVKEAERLVATIPQNTDFLIFLGLGGGFAPLAALKSGTGKVMVIDFDRDGVNELLSSKDYTPLLNNKRFTLLVNPSEKEIQSFILQNYNPALYGGTSTIPLRTRIEADTLLFKTAAQSIQQAISLVSSDYSAQAHFGKQWFSNIIRNIAYGDPNTHAAITDSIIDEAAVVAAGPSLDMQITQLAECKERDVFIICSDTAAGTLLHHGIKPDTIVSIDCQHISYYHFLNCNSHGFLNFLQNIPLILDIASPPLLASFSVNHTFFSSGHPLARYINYALKPMPQLDTSGGNVTYTCISFAEYLGAKRITLFGADFAYVKSRTYAKGTYIYPYFEKRQNRLNTLEAQLSAFLYRSPFLSIQGDEEFRETAQLRFYREKLEQKTGISIVPGSGNPAVISLKNFSRKSGSTAIKKRFNSGADFLKQYRKDIISAEQGSEVFTTLLPYAAYLKHRNPNIGTKELIELTKSSCSSYISAFV